MYKIGDKVKIIDPIFTSYGKVGTIVHIWETGSYEYGVYLPYCRDTVAFRHREVERVS